MERVPRYLKCFIDCEGDIYTWHSEKWLNLWLDENKDLFPQHWYAIGYLEGCEDIYRHYTEPMDNNEKTELIRGISDTVMRILNDYLSVSIAKGIGYKKED